MSYDPEAFGARCHECYLRTHREGLPVGPELNNTGVVVVTESPREKDVEVGRPLVDAAGMEFTTALKSIGIPRNTVTLTTALACRPPENDLDKVLVRFGRANKKRVAAGVDAMPHPLDCCRPRMMHDIGQAKNLITLGKVATKAVTGIDASITEIRGGPIEGRFDVIGNFITGGEQKPDVKVLPTLHPAFVMRARRWTRAFRSDLSRAFRWFAGGLGWREPAITLNPTPDELEAFLSRTDIPYIYDVETTFDDPLIAKLKCVGIAHENAAVVVHLLRNDLLATQGLEVCPYNAADEARIRGILRDFFIDPLKLKAGHNAGAFDRAVIEQHFGVTPAPLIDTILLHRLVESELPHKLGYIGSVYTDVTSWKAAHTAEVAVTDEELGTYCLFHGTMVQFADGKSVPIHEVVEKKMTGDVVSRTDTGEMVARPIIGWHRNTVHGQAWWNIRLGVTRPKARGLITTPDHKIHTTRGKIPAGEVRVGDEVFINERQLSQSELQAIIGTCLGDSILVVSPTWRNRWQSAPSAALSGGHSTDSGFAQYKAAALSGVLRLGKELPARSMQVNGRKGEAGPFIPLHSPMLYQLAALQHLFRYPDGMRRLSVDALSMAGAIGLAWWFMDDGCRQNMPEGKRQSIVISTQRYPLADVDAAHRWLEARFGRIYLGVDKVLRFSPAASEAFGRHIAPNLPPEARYKLPQDVEFPPYQPGGIVPGADLTTSVVVFSEPHAPTREKKHQRIRADTRYCIDVEDTHNFMTADGLVQNCAIDCVVTARVLPKLAEAVQLRNQQHLVAFDHKVQDICAGMHKVGMLVDRPLVAKVGAELKTKIADFLAQTREAAGDVNMNPNSVYQVRDLLFDKWGLTPSELTKLGDPSTSDEALRLLRTQNKDRAEVVRFIDSLRRFRKVSKEYGTYVVRLVPYHTQLNQLRLDKNLTESGDEDEGIDESPRGLILADGRIHPNYLAHGTTSGRLSSSNPNAQNFPKHLRNLILAQPGHVLVGADADQLELRIIASVAGITRYLDVLEKGADPHAETSSMMFGKQFDSLESKSDQWTKLRQIAKGIAYASFYGSGDETVHGLVTSAENKDGTLMYPDLTLAQVATLRKRWLASIPQMQAWWDDCLETFQRQSYMIDPVMGRRRDFLDGEKFNEIINFGIQSAGAHIIHISTFDLMEELPFEKWGPGTGLINQCHDALVYEVPCPHGPHEGKDAEFGWCPPGCKCEANRVARLIKESMNRTVPGLDGVKFAAKPKIGLRWGEV